MPATARNPTGVRSGLSAVEPSTSPRLSARLPLAFCTHAVDEPAIGMAPIIASPTRMFCASSGLCQAASNREAMKANAIG